MNSLCAVRGCGNEPAFGMRLCSNHLDQAQAAHSAVKDIAESISKKDAISTDLYDSAVAHFTARIGMSEQMRKLTFNLIESGMHHAIDSFPGLEAIPPEILEQLTSFLAVNIVSSVIQERAHMMAKADMLANLLPKNQVDGLRELIAMEMELTEGKETEAEADGVGKM